MQTVTITGGTGMIGTALSRLLIEKGYAVIVLTREQKPAKGNLSYARWDVKTGTIDRNAIEKADHIVHLAGANVAAKRWTAKVKKEIVDSRVDSSGLIVRSLSEIPNNVQTVVSASAIGWYGPDRLGRPFVESDPAYSDFLGETCRLWEASISPVTQLGKRLAIVRTPLVFSKTAGVFKELTRPLSFGIAGILGSGKQVLSWIHLDDLVRVYVDCIENKDRNGPYNANTDAHITNKELILKTAKARKRPFIPIHVPSPVLKLMLGEMGTEVLKSCTVDGSRLRNAGFTFLYPTTEAVVNALVSGR